jgi:hypothetical protein
MGGNIVVKFEKRNVWLYTKKFYNLIPEILQRALIRGRGSWGDTATLTHIIYSEMVKLHLNDDKGFGISPYPMDNRGFIFGIDDQDEKVAIFFESGKLLKRIPFEQFCLLEDLSITNITEGQQWDYFQDTMDIIPDFTQTPYY